MLRLFIFIFLLPSLALSQTWTEHDTSTYQVVNSGMMGTDATVTVGIDSYIIEFTQKGECIRWELDFILEDDGMKLYVGAGGEYYYVEDKDQFVMMGKRVENGSVRKYVIGK